MQKLNAQGAAACVNSMHVMGDLSASPSAIKQVLSLPAVDLNHALKDNNTCLVSISYVTHRNPYAQGAAACVNAMHVMGDLRATPSAIKQVLSSAAVDLNHALSPSTIVGLEAYRDQCIVDCELSESVSAPEYHSMVKGLAVDAPILRFSKRELVSVCQKLFGDCPGGTA
jgi:hypothetical protein